MLENWLRDVLVPKEAEVLIEIFSNLNSASIDFVTSRIKIDNGHVMRLNLSNCGLTRFPKNLTHLTELTALDLSSNKLYYIPYWICLSKLISLDLSSNKFHEIRFDLKGLKSLKYLDIQHNKDLYSAFHGNMEELLARPSLKIRSDIWGGHEIFAPETVPLWRPISHFRPFFDPRMYDYREEQSQQWVKIEEGHVVELRVQDIFPGTIGTLIHLRELTFFTSKAFPIDRRDDSLPDSMRHLKNLQLLDLGDAFELYHKNLEVLWGLPSSPTIRSNRWGGYSLNIKEAAILSNLDVFKNKDHWETTRSVIQIHDDHVKKIKLTDHDLDFLEIVIERMEELEELDLSSMELSSLPETIGIQTRLKVLNLKNNQLTSLPQSFWQLRNLEILDISSNPLSFLSENIDKLKNLEILNLSKTNISVLPKSIINMEKLQSLDLSETHLSSFGDIGNIINRYKHIDLSKNIYQRIHYPWLDLPHSLTEGKELEKIQKLCQIEDEKLFKEKMDTLLTFLWQSVTFFGSNSLKDYLINGELLTILDSFHQNYKNVFTTTMIDFLDQIKDSIQYFGHNALTLIGVIFLKYPRMRSPFLEVFSQNNRRLSVFTHIAQSSIEYYYDRYYKSNEEFFNNWITILSVEILSIKNKDFFLNSIYLIQELATRYDTYPRGERSPVLRALITRLGVFDSRVDEEIARTLNLLVKFTDYDFDCGGWPIGINGDDRELQVQLTKDEWSQLKKYVELKGLDFEEVLSHFQPLARLGDSWNDYGFFSLLKQKSCHICNITFVESPYHSRNFAAMCDFCNRMVCCGFIKFIESRTVVRYLCLSCFLDMALKDPNFLKTIIPWSEIETQGKEFETYEDRKNRIFRNEFHKILQITKLYRNDIIKIISHGLGKPIEARGSKNVNFFWFHGDWEDATKHVINHKKFLIRYLENLGYHTSFEVIDELTEEDRYC